MHDTGGFMCKIDTMSNIPIPPVTSSNRDIVDEIEALVGRILSSKADNPTIDTGELEREIDLLVYELYDLTYDEVKIIDPDFGLSREEYESITL